MARWKLTVRLRHLFVLVTVAAVLVWVWPRLGLEVDHKPGVGSRVAILWDGSKTELWNTFKPAPVTGFVDRAVITNGSGATVYDVNISPANSYGVE